MTWTYFKDLSTTKDQVRFLIGDTNKADQQLADEEITFLATLAGPPRMVAALAAEAIAATYARKVTSAVGPLSVQASERYEHYMALAGTLRTQQRTAGAVPFAGGISVTSKDSYREDEDRIGSPVRVDQFNNPDVDDPMRESDFV